MPKQGAQAAHWYTKPTKYIYKFKGRRRHPKPAAYAAGAGVDHTGLNFEVCSKPSCQKKSVAFIQG